MVIPKVYDGRNRTFFFWNYEKYQDKNRATFGTTTVPNDALRNGDFSSPQFWTQRNLGADFLGRPILQNTIYDPASRAVATSGPLAGRTCSP